MTATRTETKVTFDAEENLFLLFDRDGDVVDGYDTEAEAISFRRGDRRVQATGESPLLHVERSKHSYTTGTFPATVETSPAPRKPGWYPTQRDTRAGFPDTP